MRRASLAGLLVVAILAGAGIGYFIGVSSQRAVATPSVLIDVSEQACNSEGLVICGQQLSDLVNGTTLFLKAENGSSFVFQRSASGEGTAILANGTRNTFGLFYDLFGTSPPESGCSGIASVIQVTIPLINGYYAVSQMTITRQPPLCSSPPV